MTNECGSSENTVFPQVAGTARRIRGPKSLLASLHDDAPWDSNAASGPGEVTTDALSCGCVTRPWTSYVELRFLTPSVEWHPDRCHPLKPRPIRIKTGWSEPFEIRAQS